jgi:hypothetical protein
MDSLRIALCERKKGGVECTKPVMFPSGVDFNARSTASSGCVHAIRRGSEPSITASLASSPLSRTPVPHFLRFLCGETGAVRIRPAGSQSPRADSIARSGSFLHSAHAKCFLRHHGRSAASVHSGEPCTRLRRIAQRQFRSARNDLLTL